MASEPAAARSPQDLEQDLKLLIVDALKLEDVRAEEIDSRAALVGEGLDLDSIDILELAMAIHKRYGVKTSADDAENHRIYASVESLAAYVAERIGKDAG